MQTKTTRELTPGDMVRIQSANTRGILIPFAESAGTVHVVESVEPWILTTGPNKGTQARSGRRRNGPLLWRINFVGGSPLMSGTETEEWVLFDAHSHTANVKQPTL